MNNRYFIVILAGLKLVFTAQVNYDTVGGVFCFFFDEVKRMIMMGIKKRPCIDLLEANYEAVNKRMNAGARGMEEAAMDMLNLFLLSVI